MNDSQNSPFPPFFDRWQKNNAENDFSHLDTKNPHRLVGVFRCVLCVCFRREKSHRVCTLCLMIEYYRFATKSCTGYKQSVNVKGFAIGKTLVRPFRGHGSKAPYPFRFCHSATAISSHLLLYGLSAWPLTPQSVFHGPGTPFISFAPGQINCPCAKVLP